MRLHIKHPGSIILKEYQVPKYDFYLEITSLYIIFTQCHRNAHENHSNTAQLMTVINRWTTHGEDRMISLCCQHESRYSSTCLPPLLEYLSSWLPYEWRRETGAHHCMDTTQSMASETQRCHCRFNIIPWKNKGFFNPKLF